MLNSMLHFFQSNMTYTRDLHNDFYKQKIDVLIHLVTELKFHHNTINILELKSGWKLVFPK